MAEYSFMHALDVWYDRIDIEKFIELAPDRRHCPRFDQGGGKWRVVIAAQGRPLIQAADTVLTPFNNVSIDQSLVVT